MELIPLPSYETIKIGDIYLRADGDRNSSLTVLRTYQDSFTYSLGCSCGCSPPDTATEPYSNARGLFYERPSIMA